MPLKYCMYMSFLAKFEVAFYGYHYVSWKVIPLQFFVWFRYDTLHDIII